MAERELLVDGMQALLPGLDLLEFGAEIRELLLDRELLLISSQIDDFILVVALHIEEQLVVLEQTRTVRDGNESDAHVLSVRVHQALDVRRDG